MVTSKDKCKIDYFVTDTEKKVDRETSARLTKTIHNEFKGCLLRYSCFERMFSL